MWLMILMNISYMLEIWDDLFLSYQIIYVYAYVYIWLGDIIWWFVWYFDWFLGFTFHLMKYFNFSYTFFMHSTNVYRKFVCSWVIVWKFGQNFVMIKCIFTIIFRNLVGLGWDNHSCGMQQTSVYVLATLEVGIITLLTNWLVGITG